MIQRQEQYKQTKSVDRQLKKYTISSKHRDSNNHHADFLKQSMPENTLDGTEQYAVYKGTMGTHHAVTMSTLGVIIFGIVFTK